MYQYEAGRESMEYFSPSPHSRARRASVQSAVFNLISTIIGGGILSLPYSFNKCGLLLAGIFLLLSAAASDFSLYILVSCSRRSGAHSYESVAMKAFGTNAKLITMLLIIAVTYLSFVAYVVLTRDLASALVGQYLSNGHFSSKDRNMTAIIAVAAISPLFFFRSLHALRFTSITSLISVFVLVVAISIRSFSHMDSNSFDPSEIKILPTDWKDPVYAFPIISVAFLCHFNVLPVYGELHRPTRKRLKRIVHVTMFSAFIFYMVIGLMGYLFAFQMKGGVQDDILNNFATDDHLINVGRAGLTITIMLSFPLLLFPCRDTIYRFLLYIRDMANNSSPSDESKPLIATITIDSDEDEDQVLELQSSTLTHVILTVLIATSAVWLALSVSGVSVIWSIMGSTVGILISYILPTVCYIRIRDGKHRRTLRMMCAWVLFIGSSIACLFCTIQAVFKLASGV